MMTMKGMNMTKTTNAAPKRRGKPKRPSGVEQLKTSIMLGSVLATLIGGSVLANHPVEPPPPAPSAIVVPQGEGLAPLVIDEPIHQLQIPAPVARSRSSR